MLLDSIKEVESDQYTSILQLVSFLFTTKLDIPLILVLLVIYPLAFIVCQMVASFLSPTKSKFRLLPNSVVTVPVPSYPDGLYVPVVILFFESLN